MQGLENVSKYLYKIRTDIRQVFHQTKIKYHVYCNMLYENLLKTKIKVNFIKVLSYPFDAMFPLLIEITLNEVLN